jgi:hypothetical protein
MASPAVLMPCEDAWCLFAAAHIFNKPAKPREHHAKIAPRSRWNINNLARTRSQSLGCSIIHGAP